MFYPLSDSPPAVPCKPHAPAVDDVSTAPRSSTHQSSFQNHTLKSKEKKNEAESDNKLNQAPVCVCMCV